MEGHYQIKFARMKKLKRRLKVGNVYCHLVQKLPTSNKTQTHTTNYIFSCDFSQFDTKITRMTLELGNQQWERNNGQMTFELEVHAH